MAQGWRERIVAGQIYSIQQLASGAKLNFRYAARIFRLATLSPEIVDAMVDPLITPVMVGLLKRQCRRGL
jgi:hypothetical protein